MDLFQLVKEMERFVRASRTDAVVRLIESRSSPAERDEARTAYLHALLGFGRLKMARHVADEMENEETAIDALLLVAESTGSPDDETAVRIQIERGKHNLVCRTGHYAALYRRSKHPLDLMAARKSALRIPSGAEKAGAFGEIARATLREGDFRGFCLHAEEVTDPEDRAELFRRILELASVLQPIAVRHALSALKTPEWVIAVRGVIGLGDQNRTPQVLN